MLPKRIIKETEKLEAEPVPGISAVPHDSNPRYFNVIIKGPEESPYGGKNLPAFSGVGVY